MTWKNNNQNNLKIMSDISRIQILACWFATTSLCISLCNVVFEITDIISKSTKLIFIFCCPIIAIFLTFIINKWVQESTEREISSKKKRRNINKCLHKRTVIIEAYCCSLSYPDIETTPNCFECGSPLKKEQMRFCLDCCNSIKSKRKLK